MTTMTAYAHGVPSWIDLATPDPTGALGADVRLSVRARDVMVATQRPEGLSALNILSATVTSVAVDGASATVSLSVEGSPLVARLTRRSVETLGLRPGLACFAIIKSVALIRG